MKKSNSTKKALGAFKKLGAVALITATIFFVACNQTGGGGGGSVVKDVAVLTLSPDKLTIRVMAVTSDGSAITVEGCTETTLASNKETTLTATGTTVILKGNITGLSCHDNQLTALNVQGLTSLQGLYCHSNKLTALNVSGLTALQALYCDANQLTELNVQGCTSLQKLDCSKNKIPELNVSGLTALNFVSCHINQLNAQAMTKLLNALPAREAGDKAWAGLYTEMTSVIEGNCKDFSQPDELKAALDSAKKRNWKLQKYNVSGDDVDL